MQVLAPTLKLSLIKALNIFPPIPLTQYSEANLIVPTIVSTPIPNKNYPNTLKII